MNGRKLALAAGLAVGAFVARCVWPESPEVSWVAGTVWGAALATLVIVSRRS